jgi:hypothetical protein
MLYVCIINLKRIAMYRYLFLTMFSFVSLVEGSFRSQREHGASEDVARAHPGFGAAVLVVQYGRDFKDVSISNGIYIAPGKVLTHSHERMQIKKTYVVSPFAGFENFPCEVDMTIEGDSFSHTTQYLLPKLVSSKEHCRKVKGITFPTDRTEVAYHPVRRELDPNDPESLEFVANYEGYVHGEVIAPLPIIRDEGVAIVGSDFCILDIEPFPDHPTAKLYSGAARETEEKFPITVLGYSFQTHVCDGSDHLLQNSFSRIAQEIKADGKRDAKFEMLIPARVTCFSQSVRQINDKFVAEAVCGATRTKPAGISGDEIFDKDRTDSDIHALIVAGLSGSGVYIGDELIGLVSYAHKCNLTEFIERELIRARADSDNIRIDAYTAMHPSTIRHPLLNVHQNVTKESVAPLLSSGALAR